MGRSNHICMSLVWIVLLVVFVWPIAFAVSVVWIFLMVSIMKCESLSLELSLLERRWAHFSIFQEIISPICRGICYHKPFEPWCRCMQSLVRFLERLVTWPRYVTKLMPLLTRIMYCFLTGWSDPCFGYSGSTLQRNGRSHLPRNRILSNSLSYNGAVHL
jgi:hypothetical protein